MSPRTSQQFEAIRKERKAEILDAALHVFAEEGYHTASVSKLAQKAGISKGLMYNYFRSKEEVLKTLIIDMFDEVMSEMDIKMGQELTREEFIRVLEMGIDMAVRNPGRWKLYMSLTFQPDVMPIIMADMMPRVQPYMQSLSNYFHTKGYEDPVAMMSIFSAMIDGIQMHCILDPQTFPVDQAKKFAIKLFA